MVICYCSLTLGSIEALSDLIDKTQSQSEANIDSVYTVACQVYTRCAIPIAETKVDLPVDYVVSKLVIPECSDCVVMSLTYKSSHKIISKYLYGKRYFCANFINKLNM